MADTLSEDPARLIEILRKHNKYFHLERPFVDPWPKRRQELVIELAAFTAQQAILRDDADVMTEAQGIASVRMKDGLVLAGDFLCKPYGRPYKDPQTTDERNEFTIFFEDTEALAHVLLAGRPANPGAVIGIPQRNIQINRIQNLLDSISRSYR